MAGLEPGSLADRIHALLMRSPEDGRSAVELAQQFSVTPRHVETTLREHVARGLFRHNGGDWFVGAGPVSAAAPAAAVLPFDALPRARQHGTKLEHIQRVMDTLRPGTHVQVEPALREAAATEVKRRHRSGLARYATRTLDADGRFGLYRLPDARQVRAA